MTAGRAVCVVVGLAATITVSIIAMTGRAATTHPRQSRTSDRGELASVDRAAIQRVARQFAITVSDHRPAQPAAGWGRSGTDLVTPTFGRQLADQRPVETAAESGMVARLDVASVAVIPGTPATALVLGTLGVDTPGDPAVRAPVTWILTVVDTSGGWRIAGATS